MVKIKWLKCFAQKTKETPIVRTFSEISRASSYCCCTFTRRCAAKLEQFYVLMNPDHAFTLANNWPSMTALGVGVWCWLSVLCLVQAREQAGIRSRMVSSLRTFLLFACTTFFPRCISHNCPSLSLSVSLCFSCLSLSLCVSLLSLFLSLSSLRLLKQTKRTKTRHETKQK